MNRLRIIGSINSRASWAKVARQIAFSAMSLGWRVGVEEDDDGYPDAAFSNDPRLNELLPEVARQADADLAIVRPEKFPGVFRSPHRFCMMVFEATRWPLQWIRAARTHVDMVLTPSQFCRTGLIDSGMPAERICVLPHGIDRAVFHPKGRMYSRTESLRVLYVGTPARRKGLDVLIKAMSVAFPAGRGARLTIKTEPWPPREDAIENISQRIDDLRKGGLRVEYIGTPMAEWELADLYREHDVLCLPHRGEGFGMCCLEAMACGTPVIATAWSGTQDFVDESVGWPLTTLRPRDSSRLLPRSFPPVSGEQMVEPSLDELAETLRRLCWDVPAREFAQRGTAATARARHFDWRDITHRFLQLVPPPHRPSNRANSLEARTDS